MHFLCLHGIGSNAVRFQAQLAVIMAEIGDEYTYDFVNGPQSSLPACDMFEQLAWSKGKGVGPDCCYSFFDWYSSQSMSDALDWLSSYIRENGPYDGIIAFSQSTCLAATLMLQHQSLYPDAEPIFRCAVFFQGILPWNVDFLQKGRRVQFGAVDSREASYCDGSEDVSSEEDSSTEEFEPFCVPSVHVWGTNDTFPLPQGERVSHLFVKHLRTNITHQDGHAIPAAKSMASVGKIVRAIRKTVERAQMR